MDWIKTHPWQLASAVLFVALAVVSGLLIANSGDDQGVDETPSAGSSITTSTEGSGSEESATTAPSPGESTTTVARVEITEGVSAVVVDNVEGVGPQIGLNAADIIIETPVEGGLSRFTALYGTDVPSLIGPVRSLRPVSADLLSPFAPVVFTTGGQPFVVGSVANAGMTIVTPDDSIGFQSLERPRPHHIFVTPGQDVPSGVEIVPPWAVGDWPGGGPATEVGLPISGGVTWRYEDGVYVRYRGSERHEALATFDGDAEPITRETLVVLSANQKSAGYTDSAGADVPDFDVVGSGDLHVFHDGEVLEGRWSRSDQGDGYQFVDSDGAVIAVPAGSLYLAIVPKDEGIVVN